jgi:hypothetical protein
VSPLAEVGLRLAPIVAVLAGGRWLLRAIFKGDRVCWSCKGSGKNWWSDEKRSGPCWFCGGQPRSMTRGARMIRRMFRGDRWGK